MTNVLQDVPGKQWDLEYQLEVIHQALDTEDYDQALKLAQEGLKEAESDSLYYEKFQEALKKIKINLPSEDTSEKVSSKKIKKSETSSKFLLTDIKGIGNSTAEKLNQIGISTPEQLSKATPETLAEIKGISKNSATKFIMSAQTLIEQSEDYMQETTKKPKEERSQNNSSPLTHKIRLGLDKYIGINGTTKKEKSTISPPEDKDKSQAQESNLECLSNKTNERVEIAERTENRKSMNNSIKQERFEEGLETKGGSKNETETEFEGVSEKIDAKPTSVKEYTDFVISKEVSDLNCAENKYTRSSEIDPTQKASIDQSSSHSQELKDNIVTKARDKIKDEIDTEEDPQKLTENGIKKSTQEHKKKQILMKKIRSILSDDFYILEENNSFDCDCIAIKSVKVSDYDFSLLLLPIRTDIFNEEIILSEDIISILGEEDKNLDNSKLLHEVGLLSEAKAEIFHDIITKDSLYTFLRRYLRDDFEVEYKIDQQNLFFNCGKISYSVYISPLYVCNKQVEFSEKIIPFPYQRHSDLHIIEIDNLASLMDFLVRKSASLTVHHHPGHNLDLKAKAYNNYLTRIRIYSFPIFIFGIILGIFMIPFYQLITILFGLSITASIIYIFVMIRIFFQYNEDLKNMKDNKGKKLTETDLEVINERFTLEEMEQFIYEYFGKNTMFKVKKEKQPIPKNNSSNNNDLEDGDNSKILKKSVEYNDDTDNGHKESFLDEGEDLVQKYVKIADED